MKITFFFLITAGMFAFMACGPNADEIASKKAQQAKDSIREDSLSRADADKMMNDMMGDTVKKDSVPVAK